VVAGRGTVDDRQREAAGLARGLRHAEPPTIGDAVGDGPDGSRGLAREGNHLIHLPFGRSVAAGT
jgi:hypothetical protein